MLSPCCVSNNVIVVIHDEGYWYSFSSDMLGEDQVILNSLTNKTAVRMSSVASSVQKKEVCCCEGQLCYELAGKWKEGGMFRHFI